MREISEIRDALARLSCIGSTQFCYDPSGQMYGEGEIQYLVEVNDRFFLAWEDSSTRKIIVNPITRFGLDELEELGAEEAWTVLHVPAALSEGIQFREIDDLELVDAYLRMKEWTLREVTPPVLLAY